MKSRTLIKLVLFISIISMVISTASVIVASASGAEGIPMDKTALAYVRAAKIVEESVVLTVGKDSTERNLAWFSSISAPGEVRLVEASDVVKGVFPKDYLSFSASSVTATNALNRYAKKVTLSGLKENTEYAYMIVCGNYSGRIRYFKTGAPGSSYDFVFVGDPQIESESHGNQWKDTLQKIEQNFSPEILISAGDQVCSPNDETQYGYFINDELAGFALAPSVGPGHDSVGTSYGEHFNLPNLSTEYGVDETTSNYWYTYKNTLFMHLNTCDNDFLYNGEHKAFISEAMAANKDVKWTFLITHRAPFSTGKHGGVSKFSLHLSALATEMDIDVVLSGHDHVYVRTPMLVNEEISDDVVENDTVVNPTGVLYITASSSTGSKYYDKLVKDDYFVAKENYEKRKSAIKFEITDAAIKMTSYFLDDMSIFDTFTIEHVCTLDSVEEIPATCKHEGKRAYYECSCGKAYEDADGKVLISDLETWGVIAKKDTHTPMADDGDCTTAIICSVCNEVTTPASTAHLDANKDGNCDACSYAFPGSSESSFGLIVGIVIGSVGFVCIVAFVVFKFVIKKKTISK